MPAAELTEQEFKEWSDDLRYIIWDCHISCKNFEALTPYLHKGADWQPISGFLDHLRTQYFFTLVTQLAKVYCEGEHSLRFTALMGRLSASPISSFVEGRFRHNASDQVHVRFPQFWKREDEMRVGLKDLRKEINKHMAVVERLRKCRNQVIAHTDSVQERRSAEVGAPTLSELKVLAKQAAEIHNLIQAGLGFGSLGTSNNL